MSALLDIFNEIVTKLDTIEEDGEKVIQTVGLWNDQFDNEELEKAFNYPAVFVEFVTIRWDISNTRPSRVGAQGAIKSEQKGDNEEPSLITLHCGFDRLEDPKESFPKIAPVLEAIYYAIQGTSKEDSFSPLLRLEERQDVDHDRVLDWQIDFSTTLFQCGEEDSSLVKIDAGVITIDLSGITLDIDDDRIRSGDGE